MKPNYDVVKRWVNEAQEAVSSDNTMVQVNIIAGGCYNKLVMNVLLKAHAHCLLLLSIDQFLYLFSDET